MRPIISSLDSPIGHIAQYLTDILTKSYNFEYDYNIRDSFMFSSFINNLDIPDGFILVSFDVVSLFTNLPLNAILDSISAH